MIRVALVAYLISLFSTLICISIFKTFNVPTAMASSFITGLSVFYWFAKKQFKIPEKKEFTIFYCVYSLLIFSTFFAMVYFAKSKTVPGIITVIALALVYPAIMSIFFNEKFIEKEINK